MSGSDARSEKDTKCLANNLKSFLAMINGTCWLKINKGKMDKSDISMEQAMGMMIPTIATVRESRVELFE